MKSGLGNNLIARTRWHIGARCHCQRQRLLCLSHFGNKTFRKKYILVKLLIIIRVQSTISGGNLLRCQSVKAFVN